MFVFADHDHFIEDVHFAKTEWYHCCIQRMVCVLKNYIHIVQCYRLSLCCFQVLMSNKNRGTKVHWFLLRFHFMPAPHLFPVMNHTHNNMNLDLLHGQCYCWCSETCRIKVICSWYHLKWFDLKWFEAYIIFLRNVNKTDNNITKKTKHYVTIFSKLYDLSRFKPNTLQT